MNVKSITWQTHSLVLLDQRKLPKQISYLEIKSLEEAIQSIQNMVVRGAPAIAIVGMYGFVLYLKSLHSKPSWNEVLQNLSKLESSRPTAVNLKLAIEKFINSFQSIWYSLDYFELVQKAEEFALNEEKEDIQTNQKISENGANLFGNPRPLNLLTYCNTGAIATAGIGTALGIIRELHKRNFKLIVYVLETRPYHQGSRLTTWELMQEGITCYLLCDNMA
ncbi:MAG: S-methyl-5-thioribose-1-phosphate isomerase, partial [Leptospiraceae bacterium]|nr:S-methyl-5-thioribose-1-phosphate isomerase [Leptospiraceae bacterium]